MATKMNINWNKCSIILTVLLILIKSTTSAPLSEADDTSVIDTTKNQENATSSTTTTTEESTKMILDFYESSVENIDKDASVPTTTAAGTTVIASPVSIKTSDDNSKVEVKSLADVNGATTTTTTTEAPDTTTTTTTRTTTVAPETTSNPQQMLIPPALVNASIAQMPNGKASTHKQGQIIIRYELFQYDDQCMYHYFGPESLLLLLLLISHIR